MLETILKLYVMAMAHGVRSPLPHMFGPPGCGKSSTVETAAEMLGVNLHIINVSRISPLELEGVQMPVTGDTAEDMKLRLLHATFWTQLQDGDILLFDEFLRAHPEVYNGLLDILTSRQVGGLKLPNVCILAASNSTATYDPALQDRLLHIPVADPRNNTATRKDMLARFIEDTGLHPDLDTNGGALHTLFSTVVAPMFDVLDQIDGTSPGSSVSGVAQRAELRSLRNLTGQVKLRHIETQLLADLIRANNELAARMNQYEYLVLTSYGVPKGISLSAEKLSEEFTKIKDSTDHTKTQRINAELNLQFLEVADIRTKKGASHDDANEEPIFN